MAVRDRIELRRRLAELAGTQAGYFTAAQALEAGYSYSAQRYHVYRGNWTQVDRAIFRLRDWPVGEHEDLVRWTLWSRGAGVVSHETALALHDLGDANPAHIQLTVPPGFRRTGHGVMLHVGDLPERDVEEWEGFRVTTPLRSVLDSAGGGLDLDQLGGAIDDGVRGGRFTIRELRERADEFGSEAALAVERAIRTVSSGAV